MNQLPVVRPTNILFFIFIFTQYGVRSGAYSRSMASGCWLTGVQQLSYSSQSMAPLAGGSASGGGSGSGGGAEVGLDRLELLGACTTWTLAHRGAFAHARLLRVATQSSSDATSVKPLCIRSTD